MTIKEAVGGGGWGGEGIELSIFHFSLVEVRQGFKKRSAIKYTQLCIQTDIILQYFTFISNGT